MPTNNTEQKPYDNMIPEQDLELAFSPTTPKHDDQNCYKKVAM